MLGMITERSLILKSGQLLSYRDTESQRIILMGVFTLLRLLLYVVASRSLPPDVSNQLSECYGVYCHRILEKPKEELPTVV